LFISRLCFIGGDVRRRTAAETSRLPRDAVFGCMHALMAYIQLAPPENRATACGLLLQLDLLLLVVYNRNRAFINVFLFFFGFSLPIGERQDAFSEAC
jgi:hypothetical protein